jgi:glycine cleavage system transcriptional repressor
MPEADQLILTAYGPDQVGLAEKISEFIARHGCNIEDSKMAALSGEFAIIILISGASDKLAAIARDYREVEEATALTVVVKAPSPEKPEVFLPYKLIASCMDHPGIVYRITRVLSGLGVNIESMETKTYSAPVSGAPLFLLEAEVSVPAGAKIGQLRERLAELEREENIDIEFTPVKGGSS